MLVGSTRLGIGIGGGAQIRRENFSFLDIPGFPFSLPPTPEIISES